MSILPSTHHLGMHALQIPVALSPVLSDHKQAPLTWPGLHEHRLRCVRGLPHPACIYSADPEDIGATLVQVTDLDETEKTSQGNNKWKWLY